MRRQILVPALVAGAVLIPTAAYGFWTVSSTGVNGAAKANALGAPTVSSSTSAGSVVVSVTAAPTTGPAPTSYIVNRTSPTAAGGVCTITPAANGTGNCTDPNPVIGQTNSYQVVGKLQNWVALGSSVVSTSVSVALLTTNVTAAATSPQTAGSSFNLTVTARTAGGVADTTFTGTKTITVTGAPNSPNGTAPTVPVSATFVAGVATVPVTLVSAGSTTLSVSTAGFSGSTGPLTVQAASAASYTIAGPSTAQAGIAYSLTSVTAYDTYGNVATGYTGAKTLTWSGASNSPLGQSPTASTSATFSNGVATNVPITFVKAETFSLKTTTGAITNATLLPITVSGGLPSTAAWTGITSTVAGQGVLTCGGTACTGTQLGNNGGIQGTISLTDAYGNAAANAGTGWTMVLSSVNTKGGNTSGLFTVTGSTQAAANPFTYTLPTSGSSSVNFAYSHGGNPDWHDNVTITVKNGTTVVTTLTASLDKTT
jgi:hypothetical protein